jgi:hypothetical protein
VGHRFRRRRVAASVGALLVVAVAYAAWWLAVSRPTESKLNTDTLFYGQFVSALIRNVALGLGGIFGEAEGVSRWILAPLGLSALATAVVSRKARWAWLLLLACLVPNLVLPGVTAHRAAWGLMLTAAPRYYLDALFVMALFAGIIVRCVQVDAAVRRRRVRAAVLPATLLLHGWLTWNSARSIESGLEGTYGSFVAAREFAVNVRNSLERLDWDERDPIPVTRGHIPASILLLSNHDSASNAAYLRALGYSAHVVSRRHQPAFYIDDHGQVLRHRWSEKSRHPKAKRPRKTSR